MKQTRIERLETKLDRIILLLEQIWRYQIKDGLPDWYLHSNELLPNKFTELLDKHNETDA